MNAPTDWASAVAILTAGLVLGLVLFVAFRKRSAQMLGGEADLERRDLEGKRDALISRLRELENDPKLTQEQLDEERHTLELQTAGILRQLDDLRLRTGASPPSAPAPATMNPTLKGFIWGAATVAALFGLGWFVMKSATPREEGGSPTGGMTARPPSAQQRPAAPKSPMVLTLEAAVAKEPSNLQLRNDLAQAYLENDDLMGVFEQTKFVLERAPNDTRAMTFQGLVRMAMGESEAAAKLLEQATRLDPKNLDAWVARAWSFAQQNRVEEAEAMIAEASKQSPENKARLEEVFKQMRSQIAAGTGQPAQGSELPAGHPPIEETPVPAASMARPAAPADGRSVTVTIDLDPGASLKSGVLFVMAKNPGGGPPVAAKRIQVIRFPITIEFGSADSMMGQPLPDSFRLEARLDGDGDAATKTPADPVAMRADVTPGMTVKLALR